LNEVLVRGVVAVMLSGDQRVCDICGEPIPRGSTYHVGYTTPDAVESWVADDPGFLPTFTQEVDDTVRIDVCEQCTEESEEILANSQIVVDELH
jgi:hypothetical protein